MQPVYKQNLHPWPSCRSCPPQRPDIPRSRQVAHAVAVGVDVDRSAVNALLAVEVGHIARTVVVGGVGARSCKPHCPCSPRLLHSQSRRHRRCRCPQMHRRCTLGTRGWARRKNRRPMWQWRRSCKRQRPCSRGSSTRLRCQSPSLRWNQQNLPQPSCIRCLRWRPRWSSQRRSIRLRRSRCRSRCRNLQPRPMNPSNGAPPAASFTVQSISHQAKNRQSKR